jgi:hypothetical protein
MEVEKGTMRSKIVRLFPSAIVLGMLALFFIFNGLSKMGCSAPKDGTAIQRGANFLINLQRADGAIADTVNPLFDTWETVIAAAALVEAGISHEDSVLKKALHYLQTNEDSAGMLCHNQKCRAAYCLETTAEYFLLLNAIGKQSEVQQRLDTIVHLQNPSGQWEIGNPDVQGIKDFPSVTAFVLAMLEAGKDSSAHDSLAVQWLIHQQKEAGDWGSNWEYYGCPGYALWPILRMLRKENSKEAQNAVHKAEAYMIATQAADGSWNFSDAKFPKTPSPELQTALMVLALEGCIENDAQPAYKKGIQFLLDHELPDGHWNGGYFPIPNARYNKEEYVFATAMAIRALAGYQRWQEQ